MPADVSADRLGESFRVALAFAGLILAFLVLLPNRATLLANSGTGLPASALLASRGVPAPAAVVPRTERAPAARAPVAPARPAPATAPPAASAPAEAAKPEADEQPDGAADERRKPDLRMFRQVVASGAGTLDVGDRTIRIAGIEPLDPAARCERPGGFWPCGARARTAFRGWLRGRAVLCNLPEASDETESVVAPCLIGEEDVGAWLVATGWAEAAPNSRYAPAQKAAQRKRLGIWEFGTQIKRRDDPPERRQ